MLATFLKELNILENQKMLVGILLHYFSFAVSLSFDSFLEIYYFCFKLLYISNFDAM